MDINQTNVDREVISGKTWEAYSNAYFGKKEPLEELWNIFSKQKVKLSENITIGDLGGAEGIVGEFFKDKLSKNHKVKLYVIEIIKQLLDKNRNKDTIKLNEDLRKFVKKDFFDLLLMRSILHYFSKEEQLQVLKNAHDSIKSGGHLLIQSFIQNPSDLELFSKFNHHVKRNLQLLSKEETIDLFRKSGFSEIKELGSLPTWNLSSKVFQQRYELTDSEIEILRKTVENTPTEKRKGFTLDSKSFTIPIPYAVFLLKK